MICGFHPQTNTIDIANNLTALGHTVQRITNITMKKGGPSSHSKVSIALPLFYTDLTTKANNQEMYMLRHINHQQIRVEPPNKKRKSYSAMPEMSGVKCAGAHLSNKCPLPIKKKAKYANCSGEHIANYRRCPAYAAVYANWFPKPTRVVGRLHEFNAVRENISYADVIKTPTTMLLPSSSVTHPKHSEYNNLSYNTEVNLKPDYPP